MRRGLTKPLARSLDGSCTGTQVPLMWALPRAMMARSAKRAEWHLTPTCDCLLDRIRFAVANTTGLELALHRHGGRRVYTYPSA